MASTRRTRLIMIALVATVGWSVAFSASAPVSSAHTLTKKQATRRIKYIARQVAAAMPDVIDYVAGACEYRSQHAYWCTYFLLYADGTRCGQRIRVFYKNHSSRRLSQKAVTRLECAL